MSGPSPGRSDRPGTASLGSAATGRPTNPAPASELKPTPKMVSASPVATWFAIKVSVSTAKTSARAAPAVAADRSPSRWLPLADGQVIDMAPGSEGQTVLFGNLADTRAERGYHAGCHPNRA